MATSAVLKKKQNSSIVKYNVSIDTPIKFQPPSSGLPTESERADRQLGRSDRHVYVLYITSGGQLIVQLHLRIQ